MALTDESTNMVMPVSPMYGNGGNNMFGGDWFAWIILLFLIGGNGWGGLGGYGGAGNMMLGMDFPWLLNGQSNINSNTNNGFRDAMINDGINSVRDGINSLSTQLCGCCGDMQMSLANGFAGVEQGANARQIANMQQSFAQQTATQQGFNGVQTQLCGLGSDIAREACANRTVDTQNTQSVINALNAGIQSIKDQMSSNKVDAKNEKIADLERQLQMAEIKSSQTAQNAFIQQGFVNEIDQLYNRLSNCPVPTVPVYGRQPVFTCGNGGCGCGCAG